MAVHPSGLLIPQHVNCMASHCLHKVQMKTPSLPTRLLAPVYGSLTLLALLHRLPFHPRCWDVREVGGGARLHAPAAETRLMKRSSGVFCLPREAFCVLSQAQGRERGGGLGGGGCAGSVRLAPPCSVTQSAGSSGVAKSRSKYRESDKWGVRHG